MTTTEDWPNVGHNRTLTCNFSEQNILTHLGWIRETYGSVEQCVIDLELLTADGIEQLRRNLVVDTATHSSSRI